MAAFAATALAKRDSARFSYGCQQPGSASRFATDRIDAVGASLDRVLVIDASCACNGDNGIGNLFGDYSMWFTVAALSDRAIFIDWVFDSPDRPNRTHGCGCKRARRRFDLGEHYQTSAGRSWRWTAAARQVEREARPRPRRRRRCWTVRQEQGRTQGLPWTRWDRLLRRSESSIGVRTDQRQ